jgi:hypothetical protein
MKYLYGKMHISLEGCEEQSDSSTIHVYGVIYLHQVLLSIMLLMEHSFQPPIVSSICIRAIYHMEASGPIFEELEFTDGPKFTNECL